jgi:epidermal growth factor receptor substrate 15
VDDDVDAVKQLMLMGFSREDAVAALERSSYDFQRALNSLVGSA